MKKRIAILNISLLILCALICVYVIQDANKTNQKYEQQREKAQYENAFGQGINEEETESEAESELATNPNLYTQKILQKETSQDEQQQEKVEVDKQEDVYVEVQEQENQEEEVYFETQKNEKQEMTYIEAQIEEEPEDCDIVVLTIGKPDQLSVMAIQEQLKNAPQRVKNYYVSDGWHMYVTDEDIASTYMDNKYKRVIAITDYKNKRIIFEDRDPETMRTALLHELGHYVDYKNGLVSLSNEFKEIYQEEVEMFKQNISNSNCVFDEREFFAECYNYSVINPSYCTPKALAYFQKLNIAY